MTLDYTKKRMNQLDDHITVALDLQGEYEQLQILQTDPRTKLRYKKEIEDLSQTIDNYRMEYQSLEQAVKASPEDHHLDQEMLKGIDTKLDRLEYGQVKLQADIGDLKSSILVHLDINQRKTVRPILDALDQTQVKTVKAVMEYVDQRTVEDEDLKITLEDVQKTLREIQDKSDLLPLKIVEEAEKVSKILDDPTLTTSHKLKVSIPIIPLIVSYEGEVNLENAMNLKTAWDRAKGWIGL